MNENHITARAKELLDEQEDEIKKLNELILNAKCHAIRDTQLDEKKEIKESVKDEEVITQGAGSCIINILETP